MTHPTSERTAAWYHALIALAYAAGIWWHATSALAHWRDRHLGALVLGVLLLGGCATASGLPNRHTTPAVERDRGACLDAGALWVETQDRYQCLPRPEPART